ncbi:unnamed protein product [Aphanomyces euteiches]|uniref:AP2/ERF domain-containing protein n=1 Tax=Aphanomyces euteiches TaxID=100861 RepID=A0A6G0WP87_9STRA|nr:hypothetical protein Ae201684_013156 [Aphanomyces euteiches]KAH9076817.1 hypothetical protein Ae201684P_010748 [Aphanomyces euteiches]KAH9136483.1 hypothetical protein AeRB84_018394 [Aphanomyces euteiches]
MLSRSFKHLAAKARQAPSKRLFSALTRSSTARNALTYRPAFMALRVSSFHQSHCVLDETKDKDPTASVEESDDDLDGDDGTPSEHYLGVTYHADRIKKWSASVTVGQIEVDAGQFWTEEDAAKGYDELVRMYLEPGAPINFPDGEPNDDDESGNLEVGGIDGSHEWTLPDAGSRHADIIPPIPNTYLTMEELIPALEREQAIDIYTIDLEGKSSLASYMVFCTGRSRNHMRRMADMVILSMKARNMQDDFGYVVEGRDSDDWMIADVNNIVVHFLTAETRQMLQLEDHWENMVNDKHKLYGHLSEDEYMDKYGMSELMTEDDFLHEDEIDHNEWK